MIPTKYDELLYLGCAEENTEQSAFILELHNKCRAKHEDTPPLTWSTHLQRTAEAWAEKCNYQVI